MGNWGWYLMVGLITGIWSAMFGVGGGLIMVPILTLAFGLGQKSAQGISLLVILPTALAGYIRYKMNSEISINLPLAGWLAIGGVIGAVIGSHIVFNLPEAILKRMFAALMIGAGISMMVKSFNKPPKTSLPEERVSVAPSEPR
ncbi:MAG: sulfite exporter TauE/SafE family protein [Kiritimatiellaceae bacterium]|nr:sulfite exporter TauE/SafE family protein [Kiritimatiellaceae bacterium]